MIELLAVLTAIYVAYVLYQIVKAIADADRRAGKVAPVLTAAAPAPAFAPAAAAEPVAPAPPPALAPAASAAEEAKVTTLRNPATGEVSPVPGNYRFAKKWIKEAMVAEGLLKKVYKNSELSEAVNPVVKEALEQFKKLPQYHA